MSIAGCSFRVGAACSVLWGSLFFCHEKSWSDRRVLEGVVDGAFRSLNPKPLNP